DLDDVHDGWADDPRRVRRLPRRAVREELAAPDSGGDEESMSLQFPLAHYPGFNRFVLDWLGGDTRFLARGRTLCAPTGRGAQRDLVYLRAVRAVETRDVVGPLPIPPVLIDELLAFFDMPRPQWLREGITFRDSFAELIACVFPRDVVLVDALLPELRRAGAP